MKQARQPEGIPTGGQFATTPHSEPTSSLAGTMGAVSKFPIFTPEQMQRLAPFHQNVRRSASRLEALEQRRWRNFSAIKDEKEVLEKAEKTLAHVQSLFVANDDWHAANPEVPAWAHRRDERIDALYSDLCLLDIVGERSTRSPGYDAAKKALHHSKLDGPERQILINYFHNHDHHDGDDHDLPGDPYWPAQAALQQVASKLPRLNEPVTVWRGEKYTTLRSSWGRTRQNNVDRMNRVMALKAGDPYVWDSCVATSLEMETAANHNFCFPRKPEDFQERVTWDGNNLLEHAVLFEMETDRGVFIDKKLATAAPVNEDEILLPQHMKFTVLGHWQMASEQAGRDGGKAIHVIKLKLADSAN